MVNTVVPSVPDAIATIDVGTNTALLLVARHHPGTTLAAAEVLADEAEITRLGRGIGHDGRLGELGVARTLAALERYANIAAGHGARISAIGTEALRRAPNAVAFLEPAARLLGGGGVDVITGDREAALTFRAVAESFPAEITDGRVAVIDIGGGSTEIIVCEGGVPVSRSSLPLGSVRLHERHIRHDPPSDAETRAIEADVLTLLGQARGAFDGPPLSMLVGVAGTVTSLAAMAMGLHSYDATRVHGCQLTLTQLDAQLQRLAAATQAQRQTMVGLDPRRADVIFAGALLLRTIARKAGVDAVRVSDRGIRWGLFYELASAGT